MLKRKYEMTGIIIVLIMSIVIIAVLINHANNKQTFYFIFLSFYLFCIMVAWSEDTKLHEATQLKQIFQNQTKSNKQLTQSYLQIRTYLTATMPSTLNPKTPDLHQSNKKNLASHGHCMMTKKLKLAARSQMNPQYKECNMNWFYCEKP